MYILTVLCYACKIILILLQQMNKRETKNRKTVTLYQAIAQSKWYLFPCTLP